MDEYRFTRTLMGALSVQDDRDFDDGDVNTTLHEIADESHPWTAGDGPVRFISGGTLPTVTCTPACSAPLSPTTDYYIAAGSDGDHYRLALNGVDAAAGTNLLEFDDAGTGTHTVTMVIDLTSVGTNPTVDHEIYASCSMYAMVQPEPDAKVRLPTYDEFYKAAYYDPEGLETGVWEHPRTEKTSANYRQWGHGDDLCWGKVPGDASETFHVDSCPFQDTLADLSRCVLGPDAGMACLVDGDCGSPGTCEEPTLSGTHQDFALPCGNTVKTPSEMNNGEWHDADAYPMSVSYYGLHGASGGAHEQFQWEGNRIPNDNGSGLFSHTENEYGKVAIGQAGGPGWKGCQDNSATSLHVIQPNTGGSGFRFVAPYDPGMTLP